MKIIENYNTQDVITNEELNKENPINRTTEDTEELTYVDEAVEITEEELFRDNDAVGDYFEQLMCEAAAMEFEDISSFSQKEFIVDENAEPVINDEDDEEEQSTEEEENYGFVKSLWKNKRRRAKLAYGFVTAVLIVLGTVYGFVNATLDKVQAEDDTPPAAEEIIEQVYDEEDYDLYSAVGSASSLNDYVYQWYNTGEKMSSKNVINVLLIGLDEKKGLKKGGRSDTMMLVSLNRKTEQITMVSFFRDSWVYFMAPNGKEYYSKMNGSYFYGGAECTVETIEKVFKLEIDHYVTVDFSSFEQLVDAVGGVRVDVKAHEARNMKREWNIDCPVGENVLLNGQQALYFARQRYSDADGDVSRTRRQRQVITAFIDSCKGASFNQLKNALNKVFKYVRTDLKKNEILNYATRALAGGWLNYEINNLSITDPEIFKTPTIKGTSLVIMDYPVVAKRVQEAIYGTTNIVLDENRVKIFNLY